MSIDNTALAILASPTTFLDEPVTVEIKQWGTAPETLCSIAELKAMARVWLMRKELLKFFADLDSADKTESWAWNISERLRREIEALEKE